MIFQHPQYHNKIRVHRNNSIKIAQLRQDGYIDITPEPSPKQAAHQKAFINHGRLASVRTQIREIFSYERGNLTKDQILTLNRAEIVLQQLIKKYRKD